MEDSAVGSQELAAWGKVKNVTCQASEKGIRDPHRPSQAYLADPSFVSSTVVTVYWPTLFSPSNPWVQVPGPRALTPAVDVELVWTGYPSRLSRIQARSETGWYFRGLSRMYQAPRLGD